MPSITISGAPGPDPALKARLRRELRASRGALPPEAARAAARRAIRRFWSLPCAARAQRIALYLPIGSELDCAPLAREAWRRGRQVFLPVIGGDSLWFAPFHPRTPLMPNRFGIPEPVVPVQRWHSARHLEVIVAPLVGFDSDGHRLGMGGGFYDRTLAFLRRRPQVRRPHFVGLAFELQRLAMVPAATWDVRLDAVVTESATYRFA